MPRFGRFPEPNTHEFTTIPTGLLITPIAKDEKESASKEISDYIQQKHEQMGTQVVVEMKRESTAFYKKITTPKGARSN